MEPKNDITSGAIHCVIEIGLKIEFMKLSKSFKNQLKILTQAHQVSQAQHALAALREIHILL
jgi:hypothetical protein